MPLTPEETIYFESTGSSVKDIFAERRKDEDSVRMIDLRKLINTMSEKILLRDKLTRQIVRLSARKVKTAIKDIPDGWPMHVAVD